MTTNPAILRWARETAGLTLEQAAERLALGAARGIPGADRLAALEDGKSEPSRSLLLKMSEKYRRPLLTFFLPEPPPHGDRGQDFRTLREALPPLTNATVDAIVREIRMRQSVVRSLIEDDEDSRPVDFIGQSLMSDSPATVAAALVETTGFDLLAFRSQPNVEDAFRYLRRRVEAAGVFVMLMGNLGTHHSNVEADVFRGFAISDPLAPFIVINENDAVGAWSFTLLHEFVHLMLGVTGISGLDADNDIERLCDAVAGLVLLPTRDALTFDYDPAASIESLASSVYAFARARRVSATMTAYRLHRVGILDPVTWRALHDEFRRRWIAERVRRRDNRPSDEGGPSYYVVRRHRLGDAMLSLMRRSVESGELSSTKAARALGVRPRSVYALLRTEAETAI